jgi:hypothetical protein
MTKKAADLDEQLVQALTQAYTARSKLFHQGIRTAAIDLLVAEIDSLDDVEELNWDLPALGVSKSAWGKAKKSGACPQQVFAHPRVIEQRPHLIGYYRNMATISSKGMGQLLFSTNGYEKGSRRTIDAARARELCKVLNRIISNVIDSFPDYDVTVSRKAILAEIGAQLQGTWGNFIGQGATREVERIICDFVLDQERGSRAQQGRYDLSNGWTIAFGTEPDVAFWDRDGQVRIAIEIKGSLDKAGAQTRYGGAKKSFAKALSDNPRCHTIYLASCFTESVMDQIKADGQVREWFNLTSILSDDEERAHFLEALFHVVDAPERTA